METLDILTKKSIDKVLRLELVPTQQAFKAFMAGVYISLGALFMTVIKNDTSLSPAVSALLSGLVFSIGLIFVIVCEAELFTGNCLVLVGVLNNKITMLELIKLLGHTLMWNSLGCVATASLTALSGMNVDIFLNIMSAKRIVDTSFINVVGKAMLCNVLVCLAIWASTGTSAKHQHPILIVMPVAMFVACGFEHSIADIFMVMFLNPAIIPAFNILIFLAIVIIGNVLGGFLISFLLNSCCK